MTRDAPLAPPSIPDYRLIREIGRGSYGVVWLAQGVTGIYRAVKVVWRAAFEDPQPYEREFRGIKEFAAISLEEPRQLALLHVGRSDELGFFYYVMELADDAATGREIDPARYVPHTLREFRAKKPRLPASEAVALGVDLATALAGLHTHHLVHRDIKPSNIIFVGGVPKLADIGLVASAATTDATLSRVGNPGYMPPDFPGVPSADVYGLGKILYELSTGRDRDDYPRLPADLDTIPDRKELIELNEVITRACASVPEKRYPDASALRDELLLLQAGKSVRRLRATERHLSRALRMAAVLGVVTIVAGAGAWMEHQRAAKAEAERDALAQKTFYSSGLERAQRAIETGDYGRARRLLTEIIPRSGQLPLRGLEWHMLWREAEGAPAKILRDEGAPMQHVRASPDGKLLVGQDGDMVAHLWDAATGRELKTIPDVFNLVGFSSDSRWLVGVNGKVGLQRWSVASGQPEAKAIDELNRNRPLLALGDSKIAYFVDGRTGANHSVRVWDFTEAKETYRFTITSTIKGERWDYYRGQMSPDGNRGAFSFITGRVQTAKWKLNVYDFKEKKVLLNEPTSHRITALGFSGDGKQLAVAFGDTLEVKLFDLAKSAWIWTQKIGPSPVNSLVFSSDNSKIAVGALQLQVIDAANGEPVADLRGHGAGIEDIAWLADGSSLISGGTAGDVRVSLYRESARPTEIGGLWIPPGGGRKLCLSADGSCIAATDTPDKGALMMRTTDLKLLGRAPSAWLPVAFEAEAGSMLGFLPDGSLERRRIRETADSELLATEHPFEAPVSLGSSAVLSNDKRVLVVGSSQGQIVFWNVPEKKRIATFRCGSSSLTFVAVSPDGRMALTGGLNATYARLWAVDSAERKGTFSRPSTRALCGCFSPDSSLFALGYADGSVEVRQSKTGELVQKFRTNSALIQNIAFSPDGSRLACGAPNGSIHLLAPEDGREIVTLHVASKNDEGVNSTVSNLAFADNGTVLAAYLNDGRIRLWRQ